MPIQYFVKQGDYLASIAKAHGHPDWRTIWNDGANAALRKKRGNPNVLYVGDALSIPDLNVKQVDAPTDQRHRFQVSRSPLTLGLTLLDAQRRSIANRACILTVDGEASVVTSDGNGLVRKPIPHDAKTASIRIPPAQEDETEVVIPLLIGHLDPVDTVEGQAQRLNNLGYFAGPFEGRDKAENAELLRSAIEEFQCDQSLAVDGDCGAQTQGRLLKVHGS